MKLKVHGIENVNYTSKKTGQPVVGTSLHCTVKDQAVIGEAVEKIFLSDNLGLSQIVSQVKIGDTVDVSYNNRGYVVDLALVK